MSSKHHNGSSRHRVSLSSSLASQLQSSSARKSGTNADVKLLPPQRASVASVFGDDDDSDDGTDQAQLSVSRHRSSAATTTYKQPVVQTQSCSSSSSLRDVKPPVQLPQQLLPSSMSIQSTSTTTTVKIEPKTEPKSEESSTSTSSSSKRRSRWGQMPDSGLPTPSVVNVGPPGTVKIEPGTLERRSLDKDGTSDTESIASSSHSSSVDRKRRRFTEVGGGDGKTTFDRRDESTSNRSSRRFAEIASSSSDNKCNNPPTVSSRRSDKPTSAPSESLKCAPATSIENVTGEVLALREAMKARVIALKAIERIAPSLQPSTGDEDDVGEPNSDGTWEHAKRAAEMNKTKAQADELTARQSGKHHIASFLPVDEQEKFMKQLLAARRGEPIPSAQALEAPKEDYEDAKLKEENKGFQLLQKLGWNEGTGLGTQGQGVTAPVNSGRTAGDMQGLGSSSQADEHSDIYSAYRSRMMQAYKHRPNPMNNPRRPYY